MTGGLITNYDPVAVFPAVWSWTYAIDLAAGEAIESDKVWPYNPPQTGPTDVVVPNRFNIVGVHQVLSGSVYLYFVFHQVGSVYGSYNYVTFGASFSLTTVQQLYKLPNVDEWYIKILNRSGVNPASVEGTFTIFAKRGNHV